MKRCAESRRFSRSSLSLSRSLTLSQSLLSLPQIAYYLACSLPWTPDMGPPPTSATNDLSLPPRSPLSTSPALALGKSGLCPLFSP